MRILAINSGSSSLKFQLFKVSPDSGKSPETLLLKGQVKIGNQGCIQMETASAHFEKSINASAFPETISMLLAELESHPEWKFDAIAFRVVHGGSRFTEPVLLNDEVLHELDSLIRLAPLHNATATNVIRATRTHVKDALPLVAVFDTAFHKNLPDTARCYAIPQDIAKKHDLRRFGFHGLAHRWMMERYAQISGKPATALRLITLQLGNGCSAAAIRNGHSIDTSMGLTPLEGLIMGTRSGDVDPALLRALASAEKITLEQAEEWLNKRSGMLGVSKLSGDMRTLLEAQHNGNKDARLALTLFCYRIRKYIGAYLAVLNGADAIVFGGGIGENQPEIRSRICSDMDWSGLHVDSERNASIKAVEGCISTQSSRIAVHVIPVKEELLIARDAFECLHATSVT
jgi:acetate kinase